MSQTNVPIERRKTAGEDNANDLVVRLNLSWVDGADNCVIFQGKRQLP
jgi:hypothetical protein